MKNIYGDVKRIYENHISEKINWIYPALIFLLTAGIIVLVCIMETYWNVRDEEYIIWMLVIRGLISIVYLIKDDFELFIRHKVKLQAGVIVSTILTLLAYGWCAISGDLVVLSFFAAVCILPFVLIALFKKTIFDIKSEVVMRDAMWLSCIAAMVVAIICSIAIDYKVYGYGKYRLLAVIIAGCEAVLYGVMVIKVFLQERHRMKKEASAVLNKLWKFLGKIDKNKKDSRPDTGKEFWIKPTLDSEKREETKKHVVAPADESDVVAQKLNTINRLYEDGLISNNEYQEKRRKIIDSI